MYTWATLLCPNRDLGTEVFEQLFDRFFFSENLAVILWVRLLVTMLDQVVRASSLVENTNSILRNYFFLRRQAGAALGLIKVLPEGGETASLPPTSRCDDVRATSRKYTCAE